MTVTKQQQLEWLAKEFSVWPGFGGIAIRMSNLVIGNHGGEHIITRQEWQQELYKMSSKPEVDNSWHERGDLPQIGCECEAFADGCEPESCIILAIHNGTAAVKWSKFNNGGLDVITLNGWSFRPIRTEREKAIDAACVAVGGVGEDGLLIIERLYDAGVLK